jgi:signal transduction histidine kinase/ActR/RegA family two-component response regulator
MSTAPLHPTDPERLERLLASVDEGLWERPLPDGETWYSARFRALLGFGADAWPADAPPLPQRLHRDDRAGFEMAQAQVVGGGGPAQCRSRLRCQDGHWRWFRLRMRVWPAAGGRPAMLVGTLHEIDHEVRTMTDLSTMTQRFERAIAASAEGLFEAVWGDHQVYLSERARELVGLSPMDSTCGCERLRERIHPDDLPGVRSEVASAMQGLARWQVTYRAQRFDQPGRYLWFRERGTAIREAEGAIRIWGMLADVHEEMSITERLESRVARRTSELAAALRQAEAQRHAAESANRAKASFIGQMSHELRTPLNGVLGMNQLALRNATLPEQRRFLEMAQQSARSMLHVVDDLLDFARADAGRLTLDLKPFDLAVALAEVFRGFMPEVRSRRLRMLFDYIGTPTEFIGDGPRLRQMVSNLVGNAVKFTESGHIALTARITPADASASGAGATSEGEADIRIEVTDTGPGMDAATAQRVFEPFEQADPSHGRRHGGTGLGLTIVRMLAGLMNGQATVRTEAGKGATFTISLRLPIAAHAAAPAAAVAVTGATAAIAPGHAWIVNPSPISAAWLGHRLERLGWSWEVFDSLALAMQRIQDDRRRGTGLPSRSRPAQALLITEFAIGSGDELPRLGELAPPSCGITLLVRPDYQGTAILSKAQSLGFDAAFLPLVPADLQRLLAPRGRRDGATSDLVRTEPMRLETAGRVLVVEDNALNRLIAREMLGALGIATDEAESGEEAIELCLQHPPDLVLMDIQMPGLDGLQTTRRLRALQAENRLSPFPIIALTAHAMPGDEASSLDAGMDEHLTKPIQFDALRAALSRHLRVPS